MSVIKSSVIPCADSYNETEVRFHIIDPIVRALGYSGSDGKYLILEEKLEYPYVHVGRRSKKDLPLGRADYRIGLDGARGSAVIEAKAAREVIGRKEVEQAHSYAAHAQVGAKFFAVCNGVKFLIFETLSGPNAVPIVDLNLEEINVQFHQIENILSPDSLRRHSHVEYEKKLRLAEGLGSLVRIKGGIYDLEEYDLKYFLNGSESTDLLRRQIPQLKEVDDQFELLKNSFEMRVSDGKIERGEDGKIIADIAFSGATTHNHRAMQMLGVDRFVLTTSDKFLSGDPRSPTIFESSHKSNLPKGTSMPRFFGGLATLEGNFEAETFIKAAMSFGTNEMEGQYVSISNQQIELSAGLHVGVALRFAGRFSLIAERRR